MNAHRTSDVRIKATGPGFLSLLTLLFIGLRLSGHVDWPWIWVLGPLWIPLAVALGVCLVVVLSCLAFGACVGAAQGLRARMAKREEGRA